MTRGLESSWLELERVYADFLGHLRTFLSGDRKERARLLQERYRDNQRLVIEVLRQVSPEELKDLLPFLIEHVRSVHGHLQALQRLILYLPKSWLVENIETVVEPWLQTGDDEYFRRFLELYYLIDPRLTRRLAERALVSGSIDTREAGEDFLKKLEEDTSKI